MTDIPLMATGGFKVRQDAEAAVATGAVDAVGLARALILNPSLPRDWEQGKSGPAFPTFQGPAPGGVTAWYTMAIRAIAERANDPPKPHVDAALNRLGAVRTAQTETWRRAFDPDRTSAPPVQQAFKR
jgi:tRNA-dihydrouridine synthase